MKKITALSPDTMLRRTAFAVDAELAQSLVRRAKGPDARMYNMLRYFLGYVDQDFRPLKERSGKRFRPSMCLVLAQAYKARANALDAAVAIELFHNFTLIHDDVEDRDETRRGKPTVWKLWGVNDAINSGDAQNLLVAERIARSALIPKVGAALSKALVDAFLEVIEGQHLDFQLANAPIDSADVSEARYILMTQKKTGALVRISAEAAGIAARKGAKEIAALRRFGMALGLAFQIADDYASVWNTQEETGKDAYSDIREHKRTLPFLRAYSQTKGGTKARFRELYSKGGQLSDPEIREARRIIDETDAQGYVQTMIEKYTKQAKSAARALGVPEETKTFLLWLVDLLVPEIQNV